MASLTGGLSFSLGGKRIEVFGFTDAHTDGDLAVFFRDDNVLHTGDIVEVGAYPFIDWWGGGTLAGTITAVDRLLQLCDADTKIVPGHGPVVDREHVVAYREMLVTVQQRVRDAIAAGATLDEVMDAGFTREFDDARRGERAGRRFVGVLYLGLSNRR